MSASRRCIYTWFWRAIAVFALAFLFLVVLSTLGCCSAKCVKTVYQPVEVLVPVPVEGPVLPLPAPPDCGELPPPGADWRESAAWLKGCYDTLLTKIEEYVHTIVSYNETLDPEP
jgi:hypothetical protein